MSRLRKNKQLIIWFMIVALVLPLIVPSQGFAQSSEHSTSFLQEIDSSSSVEVSSRLIDQYEEEEYVTFLLKMKDQVDTERVATAVQENPSVFQTSDISLAKRTAIVSELRSTAIETQAELKEYLHQEQENGNVKDFDSFFIVNAMAVTATKEVAESLKKFTEIEKILPNETRELYETTRSPVSEVENDAQVPETSDPEVEWNIERVQAPDVWDMGVDGTGIVVASIDTGVEWDHPALVNQYRGFNEATGDADHTFNWFDATTGEPEPYDDLDHGTHVTGIMVGVEEDGSNKIGVAPGATWIGVKAFTANGGTDVDLLAAGEWIIAPTDEDGNPHPEMAPDIVNNSWGGGPGLDEWYRPMVQNWREAGIFPEFSAGNTTLTNPGGPGSVANPANYPESFATGATDSSDQLASFSLQGPSPYEEIKPEVVAPGVNIRSAVSGGGYEGGWNGTSMAGPHTSAIAALLLEVDPSLTVDDLEQIIMDTAEPLTDSSFPESPNNGYGEGLTNAYDAVVSVLDGTGHISGSVLEEGEDEVPPTYEHTAPEETFEGLDLPLTILAQDNVSVTSVKLHYEFESESFTVEADLTSGDFLDGSYEAAIPAEHIAAPSVLYSWTIEDFGGNIVESDSYEVAVNDAISTGYFQDFESYPAGWQSFGEEDSWEWGEPTSGPGNAASGDNVYATNLSGDYPNNMNATLTLPPVAVPDDGNLYLQFQQWYNYETNYDFGYVVVSDDNMESWETLLTVNGESGDWIDGEVDLSDYAGETITVGFQSVTDFIISRPGWYIDDVALSDTSIEAEDMQLGIIDSSQSLFNNFDRENVNETMRSHLNNKPIPEYKEPGNADEMVKTPPSREKGNDSRDQDEESNQESPTAGLPLSATVSVLESGRSVQTNPTDGSFHFMHVTGDFTVRAEAYGYYPEEDSVTVTEDETSEINFVLDEMATGSVEGQVVNDATGEAVTNATLLLKEDPRVSEVETDENGFFELEAYEGTYTLQVFAPSYYSTETEITLEANEVLNLDISLTPFIGYPGEIGYDDGTAENARAFFDAGNGWAVRMSLEDGQETAMVTGGLFRFWDTEWPVPGGTDFQVAVYDATGTDGSPGNQIAGPFDAEANRDGTWTMVDLESEGIIVEGDFYLMYIQTDPNPNSPGLGTDEDGEFAGRSWQYVGGSFSETPEAEGNYMIRALVNYEVTTPVITSPEDDTITNEDTIAVEGEASPNVDVHLSVNEEEAVTTESDDSGHFSAEVSLEEGENFITAAASTESGRTPDSEPVRVILDQQAPDLVIESPSDGDRLNREVVTVEGSASDDYLESVTVNGHEADLDEEGNYSYRLLLDNGENLITVVATDEAGNQTEEQITVYVNFSDLEITNITPEEDLDLQAGESVMITFESDEDLDASFVIRMPLTNLPSNANELPMREESPGYYVGYYTATSNVEVEGAEIEVIARDDYGNEARGLAEGKLNINVEE